MKKRTTFSIWYFVAAILGFFMLQSILNEATPEISYSRFRDDLANGRIKTAYIGRENIEGVRFEKEKPKEGKSKADAGEPDANDGKVGKKEAPFRVRRVDDKDLIPDLEKAGVDYRGIDDNNADVLDPALLRAGRFDRQILVDRPDLEGREGIFHVHTRGKVLGEDVDLRVMAAQTPGMVGADIANICNEAALQAVRKDREKITQADFQEAIERVMAGLERKSRRLNEAEKRVVAYHESGHAIVGHFLPHTDAVQKISIVPRGLGALGYTLQAPLEDRYLMSREELLDRIANLLGGRAAEEVVFGHISTGAQNDLERVAELARRMVCQYGMSEKVGAVSYAESQGGDFLNGSLPWSRPFSEETARLVDEEVRGIVERELARARGLLEERRDLLEAVARALLEREVLTRREFEALAGPRQAPMQELGQQGGVARPGGNGRAIKAGKAEAPSDSDGKDAVGGSTVEGTGCRKPEGETA